MRRVARPGGTGRDGYAVGGRLRRAATGGAARESPTDSACQRQSVLDSRLGHEHVPCSRDSCNASAADMFTTGGNTAVLVADSGVVLVDTMIPGLRRRDPCAGQVGHRQAGDDDHQHAHALRPCRQQHRVSGDGRVRGSREHPGEHGQGDLPAGHALPGVQGRQRQVPAEAYVQGSAVAAQREGPD